MVAFVFSGFQTVITIPWVFYFSSLFAILGIYGSAKLKLLCTVSFLFFTFIILKYASIKCSLTSYKAGEVYGEEQRRGRRSKTADGEEQQRRRGMAGDGESATREQWPARGDGDKKRGDSRRRREIQIWEAARVRVKWWTDFGSELDLGYRESECISK